MLDLVSETGELAKEVLKGSGYGKKEFYPAETFSEELGDMLFSLICIANSAEIDLAYALEKTIQKYELRMINGGSPDSANDL